VTFDLVSERWTAVAFSGVLSPTCAQREFSRVLLRPADYAYGTFVALWREMGGEFDGSLRIGPTPADARAVLSFDSLTLGEIIGSPINSATISMARHLLLTLGEERYGLPATPDKGGGDGRMGQKHGIALDGIDQRVGTVARHPHLGDADGASAGPRLPQPLRAGVPGLAAARGVDGTLRKRMKNVEAGSVR